LLRSRSIHEPARSIGIRSPIHGELHRRTVGRTALARGAVDDANSRVVLLFALLHDRIASTTGTIRSTVGGRPRWPDGSIRKGCSGSLCRSSTAPARLRRARGRHRVPSPTVGSLGRRPARPTPVAVCPARSSSQPRPRAAARTIQPSHRAGPSCSAACDDAGLLEPAMLGDTKTRGADAPAPSAAG